MIFDPIKKGKPFKGSVAVVAAGSCESETGLVPRRNKIFRSGGSVQNVPKIPYEKKPSSFKEN